MLSYEAVAEAIEAEGRKLGKLAEQCLDLAMAAAEAEATYKVNFAASRMQYRDFATANGIRTTVDAVEDHATLECADSRRAHYLAQGQLTAIRDALRAAQGRLDGLRTLATGYRQAGG